MIGSLRRSLYAAGAFLLALLLVWRKGLRDGSSKQKLKAERADHEAADTLRRTVDRKLDQRMRDMAGRGYRD